MTFDQFLQYIFSGITSGSVYALTAIGFTLVFSATQIINFAQGQMVMLGGMIGVALHEAGLPLWACFIGAVVVVAVVSVGMEQVAIRPLLRKGVLDADHRHRGRVVRVRDRGHAHLGARRQAPARLLGRDAHRHRPGDRRAADPLGGGPHAWSWSSR